MARLSFKDMTLAEARQELEEADCLTLLEIVAEKYKNEAHIDDNCSAKDLTRKVFYKKVAGILDQIVSDCYNFHNIPRLK